MPQKLQLQKVIKMPLKLDLSPSHQDDHGFLLRIHPLLPLIRNIPNQTIPFIYSISYMIYNISKGKSMCNPRDAD